VHVVRERPPPLEEGEQDDLGAAQQDGIPRRGVGRQEGGLQGGGGRCLLPGGGETATHAHRTRQRRRHVASRCSLSSVEDNSSGQRLESYAIYHYHHLTDPRFE
ncbi:hypothetical protein AVEN_222055-1, partial [Araneus ventricosus]